MSYEIMQYLIEEGFKPIMAISDMDNDKIDGNNNKYLILCDAPISKMETFDRTLVKLATGADLIKYWYKKS